MQQKPSKPHQLKQYLFYNWTEIKLNVTCIPHCVCVCLHVQYVRETDQLNKINRNEGRQKLFTLDPETQVLFSNANQHYDAFFPMIYLFHHWSHSSPLLSLLSVGSIFSFISFLPSAVPLPSSRGWTSQASSRTWSHLRSASAAASWSAAMTWPSVYRDVSTRRGTVSWPMYVNCWFPNSKFTLDCFDICTSCRFLLKY